MRRKCLLSVATLSVLLATSACTAGTPAQVSSPQPAGNADATSAHAGAVGSSTAVAGSSKVPEIGVSQWNAAQAAKTEAAKTAKATAVEAAKAKSAAADARAAAKAAAAQSAAAKAAAKAAAAEKAAKAAAAKKGTAPDPAKTPPADGDMRHLTPVPAAPKQAPAPAESPSPTESPSPEETASPEEPDTKALDITPGTRIYLPDALSGITVGGLLP
jgi:hypothetical protein